MTAMLPVLHKERGFSLVELVLTIVILGIIAVVVVPKFFNRTTFDERFFADDLLSAARYAQRLSSGSGCSTRLDVSALGFSMSQDANCNLSSPSYTLNVPRPSDDENFANTDVPASVTVSSSSGTFIFRPDSKVTDAGGNLLGSESITLTGEVTRIIRIEGTTGYAYQN